MSAAGQVLFVPSFECPHCHAVWSYGYSKGEPKGKATCLRCVPALDAGFEAGRLAAVRADVAYAAGQLELWAARRRAKVSEWQPIVDHAGFLFGFDRDDLRKEIAKAQAEIADYSGKAADCRRWLETTS